MVLKEGAEHQVLRRLRPRPQAVVAQVAASGQVVAQVVVLVQVVESDRQMVVLTDDEVTEPNRFRLLRLLRRLVLRSREDRLAVRV